MGGGAASKASTKSATQAHSDNHNGWSSPSDEEVQWLRRALEQEKKEKEWLMSRFEQKTSFVPSSSSGSRGSPDPLEMRRMQEEVSLLRRAVDAEKSEKEWIMKRFERIEADLQSRTQECAQLRVQLSSHSTVTVPGHLPTMGTAKAQPQDVVLPQLPGQPQSPGQPQLPGQPMASAGKSLGTSASTDSLNAESPTGASKNLKARRGLSLSIQTKKEPAEAKVSREDTPMPANAAPPLSGSEKPKLEVATAPPKPSLAPSKRQEFLQKLADEKREILREPMTAHIGGSQRSTWSSRSDIEPMSPLLKRRQGRGTASADVSSWSNDFSAATLGATDPPGTGTALSIATPKLEKLEDDVPCSPKIIPRRKNRRSGTGDGATFSPIAE